MKKSGNTEKNEDKDEKDNEDKDEKDNELKVEGNETIDPSVLHTLSPLIVKKFGYNPYINPSKFTKEHRNEWIHINNHYEQLKNKNNNHDNNDNNNNNIQQYSDPFLLSNSTSISLSPASASASTSTISTTPTDASLLSVETITEHLLKEYPLWKEITKLIGSLEEKRKAKLSVSKITTRLKTLALEDKVGLLTVHQHLFPDLPVPKFRFAVSPVYSTENDDILTKFLSNPSLVLNNFTSNSTNTNCSHQSISNHLGESSEDFAYKELEILRAKEWMVPRIGRYFKGWAKLSDADQMERKREAILYFWATSSDSTLNAVPTTERLEKYLQFIEDAISPPESNLINEETEQTEEVENFVEPQETKSTEVEVAGEEEREHQKEQVEKHLEQVEKKVEKEKETAEKTVAKEAEETEEADNEIASVESIQSPPPSPSTSKKTRKTKGTKGTKNTKDTKVSASKKEKKEKKIKTPKVKSAKPKKEKKEKKQKGVAWAWKSIWANGLLFFTEEDHQFLFCGKTKEPLAKKAKSDKAVYNDRHRKAVNDVCMQILTTITLAQMLKDKSWSKDMLLKAVLDEYNMPMMNQTLSQLKRLISKLASQTI